MKHRIILFFLALLTSVTARADDNRKRTLEQMRTINRTFQVYVGRAAKKSELQEYKGSSPSQVQGKLQGSKEYEALFLCRVSDFVKGGATQKNPDCNLGMAASSKDNLNDLLPKLIKPDHKLCQNETPAHCFAGWLMKRVAPNSAVDPGSKKFDNIAYADLMQELNR